MSQTSSSIAKGDIVWGHHTAVDEDFHNSMTPDYDTGTGDIVGVDDLQRIELEIGESKEMDEPWYVGVGDVTLARDKYGSGTGVVAFQYKTGGTQENCIADTWNDYSGDFASLGWILVKVKRD